MALHPYTDISRTNRRQIYLLAAAHLLWCGGLALLWLGSQAIPSSPPWLGLLFLAGQLFAAAQLLRPVLRLQPEQRGRGFYLFWCGIFAAAIWLLNQLPTHFLSAVIKSGALLLIATLIGAALARYVKHLWELIPICLAMTLADFFSWRYGPTAVFTEQIKQHYLAPEGPPPLIDMLLVKLVWPGSEQLTPLFGISDWIMVVFFALVAHRHAVNDNLFGSHAAKLIRRGNIGGYLPISVVALFAAIVLAQIGQMFIPALPFVALSMLCWYGLRQLKLSYFRS